MEASTAAADPDRRSDNWKSAAFQIAVIVPLAVYLALTLPDHRDELLQGSILFFIVAVAVVDLIPVPAWGGMQLSLSFPILLGVAIIYDPAVAAAIAFVGSFDPREFRLQMPPLRAVFNRAQMALSTLAGGALFHLVATADSPLLKLATGVVMAAVATYAVNALCVATHQALFRHIGVGTVLAKMHGATPYEFLLSYIGLGLFGAVIARFFLREGVWSVVVFLGPLIFARQMYFRSRALADRLAEQNEILADQARKLQDLLEKEHHTVDELRQLNLMKGEFVAVVSHELRTPVTALIGYAKTLRRTEFADDPVMRGEFLERMERQGDRLLRLVENLLTASNLENHELSVSIGRVLFEDLVREVVEGLSNEASRIHVSVPDDLPVLYTDRQLLSRVLQNLVDNALKYSPEEAPCELEAKAEGEDLVFWVQDYGVGISPQELPKIFDRFYQVDSSSTRSFRGAGLGLSLVQDLLDHLGGQIEVVSRPGEGSRFTVRIPIRHPRLTNPSTSDATASNLRVGG